VSNCFIYHVSGIEACAILRLVKRRSRRRRSPACVSLKALAGRTGKEEGLNIRVNYSPNMILCSSPCLDLTFSKLPGCPDCIVRRGRMLWATINGPVQRKL